MNIGYLTPTIPYPPDEGGEIVAFNRISALAERGHEIYLFSATDNPPSDRTRMELNEICSEFVWSERETGLHHYLSRLDTPYSVGSRHLEKVQRLLEERVRSVPLDVVCAEHTHMSKYAETIDMPTCLSVHNIEYRALLSNARSLFPRPTSVPYAIEAGRMYRYELELFDSKRFDSYVFLSDTERREVEKRYPSLSNRCRHVPAGIEADRFDDADPVTGITGPMIAFTGTMRYPPNVEAVKWFVNEIFPRVRATVPSAEFYIVGKDPIPSVKKLDKKPGVTVTGSVEAVAPYLAAATASVVPLLEGTGFQIKLLEALAAGNPTVTTSVATRGTSVKDGTHALVADDAAAFASALTRVLRDPESFAETGAAGRALVESQYSWNAVIADFEALLAELVTLRS